MPEQPDRAAPAPGAEGLIDRLGEIAAQLERADDLSWLTVDASRQTLRRRSKEIVALRERLQGYVEAVSSGRFKCEACGTGGHYLEWASGLDGLICPNCSGAD